MTFGTAALRPSEPLDRLQPIDSGALVDHGSLLGGSPSHAKKSHVESKQTMSSISTDDGPLSDRVAKALSRRVGQGRPVGLKQFAFEMRVAEQTVWLWLNGRRAPRGDYLVQMMAYFDAGFSNEIFAPAGCVIVKLSDLRAAQAFKDLNSAREEALRALAGEP